MRRKLNYHLIIQIIVFCLLVSLDQITKTAAFLFLKNNGNIPFIGNAVVFHYLENSGAAFGILQNKMWLFYILTIIIFLALIGLWIMLFIKGKRYIRTFENKKEFNKKTINNLVILSYTFIVLSAGAIGNLIDRIFYGHVIDFIYFQFMDFPVFNLADICVTISAVFLFVFFIFFFKEDENLRIFGKKR